MRDKRTKCCSNEDCEHGSKRKKYKYSAGDLYCKACGSELVFVCSKCLGPLADQGLSHKLCMTCEAKAKDRKDNVAGAGKKVAGVAVGAAVAVGAFIKNDGVKKVADVAVKIIKK